MRLHCEVGRAQGARLSPLADSLAFCSGRREVVLPPVTATDGALQRLDEGTQLPPHTPRLAPRLPQQATIPSTAWSSCGRCFVILARSPEAGGQRVWHASCFRRAGWEQVAVLCAPGSRRTQAPDWCACCRGAQLEGSFVASMDEGLTCDTVHVSAGAATIFLVWAGAQLDRYTTRVGHILVATCRGLTASHAVPEAGGWAPSSDGSRMLGVSPACTELCICSAVGLRAIGLGRPPATAWCRSEVSSWADLATVWLCPYEQPGTPALLWVHLGQGSVQGCLDLAPCPADSWGRIAQGSCSVALETSGSGVVSLVPAPGVRGQGLQFPGRGPQWDPVQGVYLALFQPGLGGCRSGTACGGVLLAAWATPTPQFSNPAGRVPPAAAATLAVGCVGAGDESRAHAPPQGRDQVDRPQACCGCVRHGVLDLGVHKREAGSRDMWTAACAAPRHATPERNLQ